MKEAVKETKVGLFYFCVVHLFYSVWSSHLDTNKVKPFNVTFIFKEKFLFWCFGFWYNVELCGFTKGVKYRYQHKEEIPFFLLMLILNWELCTSCFHSYCWDEMLDKSVWVEEVFIWPPIPGYSPSLRGREGDRNLKQVVQPHSDLSKEWMHAWMLNAQLTCSF